jgi:hypothetical protein
MRKRTMRKLGTALAALALLAACSILAKPPQSQIVSAGLWGCRDRATVVDLLFLGSSAAFDSRLAHALGDGTCVAFAADENVAVVAKRDSFGLLKVQRLDKAQIAYWTQSQNVR